MQKIFALLAILCWQTAQAQEPVWLVEVVSFPAFEDASPEAFEPQITFALDQDWDFHNFSLSTSGTFSTLNGITVGKDLYPYIVLSYNPWLKYSYTSFGISKNVRSSIAYVELGFGDADFKNWSIGVGMIYSIEFPNFSFKNKKRSPP